MSDNRLRSGDIPGLDCPREITFEQFLVEGPSSHLGVCRIQGHNVPPTKSRGRLVRWNRSVRVLPETAKFGRWPSVTVRRVQWNCLIQDYVDIGEPMRVMWRDLDWFTPQASNDPNGTWVKVVQVRG